MLGAKTAEPRDNVYCVFLCSHLFRQGRVRLWLHWSIYFAASSLVWFVCDQTDNYPFLCHNWCHFLSELVAFLCQNWWHFLSELVASIIFRRIGSTVLFYTMGPEFPAAWMLWWSCFFVTPNVLSCRKKKQLSDLALPLLQWVLSDRRRKDCAPLHRQNRFQAPIIIKLCVLQCVSPSLYIYSWLLPLSC